MAMKPWLDSPDFINISNGFALSYKDVVDGHSILADPMVIQITFRKTDDKWMAINGVESSVRHNVKNTETAKELDQIELNKKNSGSWKYDINKDTTLFRDIKSAVCCFTLFISFFGLKSDVMDVFVLKLLSQLIFNFLLICSADLLI